MKTWDGLDEKVRSLNVKGCVEVNEDVERETTKYLQVWMER